MGNSPSKDAPKAVVSQTTVTTTPPTIPPARNASPPPPRDTFAAQPDFIDLSLDDDDPPPRRQHAPQPVIDLCSDSESDDVEFLSSRTIQRPLPPFNAAQSIQQAARATFTLAPIHSVPLPPLRDLPPADALGGTLTIFTDGSYKARRGGAGATYKHNKIWYGRAVALGVITGPDQAEMEGIRHALHMALAIVPRIGATKLVIQTDSQECIAAIEAAETGKSKRSRRNNKSGHFASILEAAMVDKVSLGIEVKFWWVKAHNNTEGNERADRLAGFGSNESILHGAEDQVWENPIRRVLDMVGSLHRSASLQDERDLVITGATGLPVGREITTRKQLTQRKQVKRAKRQERKAH